MALPSLSYNAKGIICYRKVRIYLSKNKIICKQGYRLTAALPIYVLILPKVIKRTNNINQLLFAYMQVTLRGFNIKMPQQIFDISYISSFVKQVGGKTMPQAMNANIFFYSGFIFCIGKYLLHGSGRVGCHRLLRFK